MLRKELPRVNELAQLIGNRSAPSAYFPNDFENSLDEPERKQAWLAREQELQGLDGDSWNFLKNEILPYLTKRDPNGRGWQQFITILNQAYAYNYLRQIGCSNVQFIRPSTQRGAASPDLQGEFDYLEVLCEVKSINISDEEALARRNGTSLPPTDRLERGFFSKLMSHLKKAGKQMGTYHAGTKVRRITYVVIDFDDLYGEYKESYYQQIDRYLTEHRLGGIEIVFHNQRTAFHHPITMTSATFFNE